MALGGSNSVGGGVPHWVVPGAKVVCVDDSRSRYGEPCPCRRLAIYTVREAVMTPEGAGLHLTEIAGLLWHGRELPFPVERFRPVTSRTSQQDIAIFRPILDQVREDA